MEYVAAIVVLVLVYALVKRIRESRFGKRTTGGGGGDGKPRAPY